MVKIDDVAYEELFNILVYNSISDKLFESNSMLIIILTEYKILAKCS
jgi:hypothetical protein